MAKKNKKKDKSAAFSQVARAPGSLEGLDLETRQHLFDLILLAIFADEAVSDEEIEPVLELGEKLGLEPARTGRARLVAQLERLEKEGFQAVFRDLLGKLAPLTRCPEPVRRDALGYAARVLLHHSLTPQEASFLVELRKRLALPEAALYQCLAGSLLAV